MKLCAFGVVTPGVLSRGSSQLDSGLNPHQQACRTKLTLPADFASKEAEELDRADFYEQLQKVRDGYAYPLAVHHQQDDSEASDALKKAKFVLAKTDTPIGRSL